MLSRYRSVLLGASCAIAGYCAGSLAERGKGGRVLPDGVPHACSYEITPGEEGEPDAQNAVMVRSS